MDIVTFSLFWYFGQVSSKPVDGAIRHSRQFGDGNWQLHAGAIFEEDPSTIGVNLNVTCKGGGYVPTAEQTATNSGVHSGFTMLGLDIEGDGDKDLVVSVLAFNSANILINDGDAATAHIGSQDVTFPANFDNTSMIDIYTFPAVFLADVNNDGFIDIYVSNDFHENDYLYINNGNGTFTESSQKMMEHTSHYSMGNDIADFNNDGFVDIVTVDMLPEDISIFQRSVVEDSYDFIRIKTQLWLW